MNAETVLYHPNTVEILLLYMKKSANHFTFVELSSAIYISAVHLTGWDCPPSREPGTYYVMGGGGLKSWEGATHARDQKQDFCFCFQYVICSSPRRFLHNPLHLSALVKMAYLLLLFM